MPTPEGRALIAELVDGGDQEREVYARYGLASYFAQVLEQGLVNLLVCVDGLQGKFVSHGDTDARYEQLYGKTMGGLVGLASSEVNANDLELCRRAVARRNRLTHHYFREHAEDFFTPQGRQRMVDDTDEAIALFQAADEACSRLLYQIGAEVGLTHERVAAQVERLVAEAERREAR